MTTEFLLMKLDGDETLKAAEEMVAALPEGMAQIVTWADFEAVATEGPEAQVRQVPDPEPIGLNTAEGRRRSGWYRNREEERPLQTQQKAMGFFASKLGA